MLLFSLITDEFIVLIAECSNTSIWSQIDSI